FLVVTLPTIAINGSGRRARIQKQGNGVKYPRFMIGRTISHYRVLSKLGAGGMGDVYVAEDTRLDRKVAIKYVVAGFSARCALACRWTRSRQLAGQPSKLNEYCRDFSRTKLNGEWSA